MACAQGGSCSVGDTGPGGGIVFYKDLTRPAGSRYFEAACSGWSDGVCGGGDLADPQTGWGCKGTDLSGASATAIGSGQANTTEIVSGCQIAGIPAKLADVLAVGGKSDWFLPSLDEIREMDLQKSIIGIDDGWYWTSSEETGGYATDWAMARYGSGVYGQQKDNSFSVRPVRSF